MERKRIGFFTGILILCLLTLVCALPGTAEADMNYTVPGENYELPDTSEYMISQGKSVDRFFYGAKSMGSLCVVGDVDEPTTYNGFAAYGTNGSVTIRYQYNGAYLYKDARKWYVDDDGMGKVNGYDFGGLFRGVGHGCIVIEKSSDGKTWNKIKDPILNYFTENKDTPKSLIYSIPEFEIKNGCYYRVIVAYRFCRKTKDGFMYFGDQYDRRKCLEVYSFFVSSEKNYVSLLDMSNGLPLQDQSETTTGFQISKNGSNAKVTVRNKKETCLDFDCFTEPGEYTVDVTTTLGAVFTNTVTVTDGIELTELKGTIYRSDKDKGFPLDESSAKTAFGSSLTSLSLVTPKGIEVVNSDSSYGIKGKSVSLYMKLNKDMNDLGSGWVLSSDSWGHNTKDLVCGVSGIGDVGKGALIIQTSTDGKTWRNEGRGKLADGLRTTDYATYYGKAQSVLIYTPSGDAVISGVHIRVLFAYQICLEKVKTYYDYVEKYEFYLCSNELGAVTFHNLSVEETVKESFADADQNEIEVYQQAETLVDGSYTTTGFRIDKTLNPTVKHTVLCNGISMDNNQDTYDASGKYDITLTSAVGNTRNLTIYVDRMEPEEAMKQYFGEGFISGKRIFSEGEYPAFEGGETSWHVDAQDSNRLPLYGQIINLMTGAVTEIEQNREKKEGVITEPGEYEAILSTSKEIFTDELKGDAWVFKFHFQIIPQGSAPGPAVNRKTLEDYSHSSVVDSEPVYYGLTYSSAGKGNITLAFASKEDAVKHACKYEKGTVEQQGDGKYRYTGSFLVGQKDKYESAWVLTDAVNYFAEAAVQKHFFDMSDEFTYLSLTDEILETTSNLRQLELTQSVTIFADDQKAKLTDTGALPLLNDKPYAYLDPVSGEVSRGSYSYKFISDDHGGIDSKNVMITDSEGNQHAIAYSESVGQQLLADNCPSGIVTVREETMYGDASEYQAVYIAPNENQTELKLQYTHGDGTKTLEYSGCNLEPDREIVVDSFRITELKDSVDPCAFVIVSHNQTEDLVTAEDVSETIWLDPGKYRVTCLNRMGYGYSVNLRIEGEIETPVPQETPEITNEPISTSEPIVDEKPEEPALADVLKEQPQEKPETATEEEKDKQTEAPAEKAAETEEKKTEKDNHTIYLIGAGVILLIGLAVLAFRRVRLFSRMAKNIKSEGEDKNE